MKYVSYKVERSPYEVIQVPEGGIYDDIIELKGTIHAEQMF